MFPMTSATEIHKPMAGGAEDVDDVGEAGGDDDEGADELELEKDGSGGAVIGGDGSTASPIDPLTFRTRKMERGWRVRSIRTRPAPS
jgi:hypothetical protein